MDKQREFMRHPSDIPIECSLNDMIVDNKEYLNNISLGGLSFKSKTQAPVQSIVNISIPLITPLFELKGVVKWCEPTDTHYNVGVEFLNPEDVFKTRMIEQICYIEHYKNEVLEKEGRQLTSEEAAVEWIKKYSDKF